MKKLILISSLCLAFFLINSSLIYSLPLGQNNESIITPTSLNNVDIILSSDENPYYALLATSIASWYESSEQTTKPFLLVHNQTLSIRQKSFISTFDQHSHIISIGFIPNNIETHSSYIGSPSELSMQLAKTEFQQTEKVLILPFDGTISAYSLSLIATPLASYLHMPILLFDTQQPNQAQVKQTLDELNVDTIYLVGISTAYFQDDYAIISLKNANSIQNQIVSTIKQKFGTLDYITITNPTDVQSYDISEEQRQITEESVGHQILFLLGKKIVLSGSDTITKKITIPPGIHRFFINISMQNITSIFPSEPSVPVFLSATLTDPTGRTVSYGHSPGYQEHATYLETIITNFSGEYTLTITLFHGYRGGFFSLRGLSQVNTVINIDEHIQTLHSSHYPFVTDLSQNAAYLTSVHGGIILADEHFGLMDEQYASIATGHANGPWYDETLHQYNNEKVDYIINSLEENLTHLECRDLEQGYLNGSGWLALLGDTNMIPMYYYPSNQTHLAERGLPSDNPYSLGHQLSPGRILSYNAADASLLIARTFFYEHLCGPVSENENWHEKFNFVFGEGFGETGGIFHQIPYAESLRDIGFEATVYGDLRNSRQAAERYQVYTNTNFVEYLGHGDWFWFTPSIYGFNSVGQSIGSMNMRDWIIPRPNVFLTSACLMGRIDGVPPILSIALSSIVAGSNAFVGATRETGQEAGLTVLEDHLVLDDYSMGEALRGEKRVDKEEPTYLVRCLYGDPAFNPYDPLHGFSNQGTPSQ